VLALLCGETPYTEASIRFCVGKRCVVSLESGSLTYEKTPKPLEDVISEFVGIRGGVGRLGDAVRKRLRGYHAQLVYVRSVCVQPKVCA